LILAVAAVVLLGAGLWLTAHRANRQAELGGGSVFTDLAPALETISEIRLSRGDGSKTTLRRDGNAWTVVERRFPADPSRVRELLLALVNMKIVETKTSDPANYAKLGVEAPDTPTAASTLVEAVAGDKTWALIVGKGAGGRAQYVRKPDSAASALVEPLASADPDQKRWIDRLLADIPADDVHDISVDPAEGASYVLSRAARGESLTLSPIPRGRKPASSMSLDSQADGLTAFNFDDVRPAVDDAKPTDRATFRTFDGQVIELAGRRTADKAYIAVRARRDAALAGRFAAKPETPAADSGAAPATPKPAEAAKPPAAAVERLEARTRGVEFEIPLYKYDLLFKKQEDLLDRKD
jgi:hypothetical protein